MCPVPPPARSRAAVEACKLVCMPANKAKQSDNAGLTTRSKPVDIARGVVVARSQSVSQTTHMMDELHNADIIRHAGPSRGRSGKLSDRVQVLSFAVLDGARLSVKTDSLRCRNKQAAALVMRRFEQFLAELDGYKLPE